MNSIRTQSRIRSSLAKLTAGLLLAAITSHAATVDYNRDIRRLLSENCYQCHGPDAGKRKGGGKEGFRLDIREDALADLGGYAAIVPGDPDRSELIRRVLAEDPDDRMPPLESGKKLSTQEIELLKQWIQQEAPFAKHWSYVKPKRPDLAKINNTSWPRNGIDYFILHRLEKEQLQPNPEADRSALARRVSLDVTGLPPHLDELDHYLSDESASAYERWVDTLLQKDAFGEHWACLWLDQARYADSTGYADDPPRTIWGFRDYVIKSFNANKPFNKFTIEQIAGDLLENPSEEELIATAFHRNTLTNNEGGTDDEEYRNVAIVDRVNTTMEVWMGTTMACAQCHNHKYDPISQEDYFRLFAIFNNTGDADRRDESPTFQLFTAKQKAQKKDWADDIERLEKALSTPTPALAQAQTEWEQTFSIPLQWKPLHPSEILTQEGAETSIEQDGVLRVARKGEKDVYTVTIPILDAETMTALQLVALPDVLLPKKGPGHGGGNFVISRLSAVLTPPEGARAQGRFVRVEIPGKEKILSLAEVQVFKKNENIALQGEAKQISTEFGGAAHLANDGNTNGDYTALSTTHTATAQNPWWELDLQALHPVDRIVVWNRTDGGLHTRLDHFKISLLDENRKVVWEKLIENAPEKSRELLLNGVRSISFSTAHAPHSQAKFEAAGILNTKKNEGWAVGPKFGQPHPLTLVPKEPIELPAGSKLTVTIEQLSEHKFHTLGKFQIAMSSDQRVLDYVLIPPHLLDLLPKPSENRDEGQRDQLQAYYLSIAPALGEDRDQLVRTRKELKQMKPYTTIPIMRELAGDKRRKTHIQRRGNFLDKSKEVTAGLPAAFYSPKSDTPPNRLDLARWLVDDNNPLTARVVVNRYWESIFGIGIVQTSEDFGSQGELPSHPDLMDWLATELIESGWDIKHLIKLMVTSATYRQSSKVTPEILALDPSNRLLARGPRFRLSAEMIRDQALFLSGLLSTKQFGAPVKPPQPKTGLSAAFGSAIDWKTSEGEDRYRRGMYTTWRRSNPYPSMVTFDAPNREVCTVRRDRTNTPLQALVTLNDPVYIEAAQALGRRITRGGQTPAEKARFGFRLCLSRPPGEKELIGLLKLYGKTYAAYAADLDQAMLMATQPLGDVPEGSDIAELATWTVVANVLLNLDEMLMKR